MKRYLIFFFAMVLLSACSGDDSGGNTPGPVNLIFPENNSLCITGIDQGNNRSEVTFSWAAASNADQYEIQVTLLGSATSQQRVTGALSTNFILDEGAPYSWQVRAINQSSGEATSSATWQFYNAGASVSYPPFPALLLQPEAGSSLFADSNGEVLLKWELADPENDQESCEVFFGPVAGDLPRIAALGAEEESLLVPVNRGVVYYWQVRTLDGQGNSSLSKLSSFRVL
jgi:hypothetical protein